MKQDQIWTLDIENLLILLTSVFSSQGAVGLDGPKGEQVRFSC